MNALNVWLCILGMAFVATIITRGAFLLLANRVELSHRVRRALHYAPAAALIAVVVPYLLLDDAGALNLTLHNDKFFAAIAAGIYFWFTRQMVGMIAVGMLAFTLLRLYMPHAL